MEKFSRLSFQRITMSRGRLIGMLLLFLVWAADARCADESKELGKQHLQAILAMPWAKDWQEVTLSPPVRVTEKSDLAFACKLPDVWRSELLLSGEPCGYLLWLADRDGHLVDFAFDGELRFDGQGGTLIQGVPPLQQFQMDGEDGESIASGCVPTSAGSVAAFLATNYFADWRGDAQADLAATFTKRFRRRMKMQKVEDRDGFADGMALAAANSRSLFEAMNEDASQHNLDIHFAVSTFSTESYRKQLDAGWPVIVTCTTRVPHKPHLSWGHSLAGVGYTQIGDHFYVGVLDNFYPTKHPSTVRWIESGAFHGLSTVKRSPRGPSIEAVKDAPRQQPANGRGEPN